MLMFTVLTTIVFIYRQVGTFSLHVWKCGQLSISLMSDRWRAGFALVSSLEPQDWVPEGDEVL